MLDRVLEEQAEDGDRGGAEDQVPAHPVVVAAPIGVTQPDQEAPRDAQQVLAEVEEHRGHRAELHDRRERGARIVPSRERGDDPQVRGRRDRQELGEALDDAQDDGLHCAHGKRVRVAPLSKSS